MLKTLMEMQAVILAGGRGTRLGVLTKNIPKPMIKVNRKPFLEYLLIKLRKDSIKDVLLCIGYLGYKIKDHFKDGSKLGLRIRYSVEDKLLGTGGALKRAEIFLNQNFILLNGDTYLPINYRRLWGYFKNQNKKGMIVVYSKDNEGNIKVKGKLVMMYDKSGKSKNLNCIDAGIQVFKKEVLKLIPKNEVVSLEEEIFPKLIKERQLAAYVTKQKFFDIGTHEGLKIMQDVLK